VALVGGVYSLYFFDVNFSVAVAVGFIALFGIAVETGVLMVVYMNEALARKANTMTVEKISATELNACETQTDDRYGRYDWINTHIIGNRRGK
jgi:Cu/Ag efflux pump CusA